MLMYDGTSGSVGSDRLDEHCLCGLHRSKAPGSVVWHTHVPRLHHVANVDGDV